MITIKQSGSFKYTLNFLENNRRANKYRTILEKYGQIGVERLAQATPKDTGTTAGSWSYTVYNTPFKFGIYFSNSNVTEQGTPIAILLQYGHALSGGGYVQGVDFINPALKTVLDQIADEIWKEVEES